MNDSKHLKKIGMPPGQAIYTGSKNGPVNISLIKYNEKEVLYEDCKDFDEMVQKFDPKMNNWIRLNGIHDVDLMKDISNHFNFNPLMIEDIMNINHLPKSEDYDDHFFITMKMVEINDKEKEINVISEHLSLVLGKNYVISYQDSSNKDSFNNVCKRLNNNNTRLRKHGPDYLFYALIDSVVDFYFIVNEQLNDVIEDLEYYQFMNPYENITNKIVSIRKELNYLRKIIHHIQISVKSLIENESDIISENITPYLRDVLDHTNHLVSSFDSFGEMLVSLLDMYMSNLSNNLNQVMKTLTIFSMFFVPLTFLAGIYGMNFQNMPELTLKWGYPFILLVMVVVVISMFFYLKRKHWL